MCSASFSWQVLMKFEFYRQIFEEYWDTKFYENPSSGSRILPCGQTSGQTNMTNLIIAFRSFANAPETVEQFTVDFRHYVSGKCETIFSLKTQSFPGN